jgi:RNA polymerase sigma-70 factor (ECF subfamily)
VSHSTINSLLTLQLTGTTTAAEASISENTPGPIAVLTRRLAAGDDDAFREFHSRYFDRLYQFLLVVARGREDEAQEALQETLLRVARYARVFEDEDAFWCWLKVVARSAARDGGRKRRRYFALLENFASRWRYGGDSPRAAEENRLAAILAEGLEELPMEDRRLIESKYLEGAAVKELSELTGLTDKAVESRLLRARRQLREILLKKLKEP